RARLAHRGLREPRGLASALGRAASQPPEALAAAPGRPATAADLGAGCEQRAPRCRMSAPVLHEGTLRFLEELARQIDTRKRGFDAGYDQRNHVGPALATVTHTARSLAQVVDGEVGPQVRDRCTCPVHKRPSAYSLTRRRLGLESSA